jgi:hypothetical protein
MVMVATVPLLIIDDFDMRKLPHTAAHAGWLIRSYATMVESCKSSNDGRTLSGRRA